MTPFEALQITDMYELKQALDIAYVLEQYGHFPEIEQNGKLHYLSPFRNEEHASFDVFMLKVGKDPEASQRFHDRGDSFPQGDVFDLLGRFHPELSLPLVQDKARELLAQQLEEDWTGYTLQLAEKPKFNVSSVEFMLEQRRNLHDMQAWWDTTRTRPGLTDVALPADTVFGDPQYDNVVFVLRDTKGEIVGARLRYPEVDGSQRKQTVPGTPNVLMRMEPPSRKPVILTEGETDLWSAWSVHKDDYEVLGVPGISNLPEAVAGHELDGRDITIMFDGDTAGMDGTHAWQAFLQARGCNVHICVLPSGRDVSALGAEQIAALPSRARHLPANSERLIRRGDQFCWILNKNGDVEPVSNWSFEPRSVLVGEDNVKSYEGLLQPGDRPVVLPAAALHSPTTLHQWGLPHDAMWSGNLLHTRQLHTLLAHEAAFLPEGRITTQVGLYEGSFVWPDGYLGPDPVYYTAPETSISLQPDEIRIEKAPVSPIRVFERMFASQHPAVMGPILAWLAVAPLRSRFKQFPILSVAGGSGSGKTTLLEEIVQVFSGSHITTNLTSSTPHAVTGYLGSSNGFPVRFDEYRPGARKDAKDALDQALRDAYTGQTSAKGGQNRGNLNQITQMKTDAPIIVTGEDNFTETSHTDRMILVRLVSSEKGNLGALQDLPTAGFAHAYLSSLLVSDTYADEPPVRTRYRPKPVSGLRDRQGANVAVLQVGWQLLAGFLHSIDPMFDMPELDLSRVIAAGEEAGASDPVMDAIRHCWENQDTLTGQPAVWDDGEYLYINSTNLLTQAAKIPGIVLPASNARGITDLLRDNHDAEATRARYNGTFSLGARGQRMRVSAIPLDRVEWIDREDHTLNPVQEDM